MTPPVSRTRERMGGTFLLVVGLWLTVYGWHVVATQGGFNVAGAMLGPAAAVLGTALLAVPGYKSERAARGEDPAAFQGWAQLTPRWKAIAVLAVALGVLNGLAMKAGRAPNLLP